MFFNQLVIRIIFSSTKPEHEFKTNPAVILYSCFHCEVTFDVDWLPSPAPSLWLIIALIFCNDKLLVLFVPWNLVLFLFTELEQLECLIVFTALMTRNRDLWVWFDFFEIFSSKRCATKLTFLFIAYLSWTLFLISSNRSSRFCRFNSSSW